MPALFTGQSLADQLAVPLTPFTELVWALEEPCYSCLCCKVSSQYQINTGPVHSQFLLLSIKTNQFRSYLLMCLLKARFKKSFWTTVLAVSLSYLHLQKIWVWLQLIHAPRWQMNFHLSFSKTSSLGLAYQEILWAAEKQLKEWILALRWKYKILTSTSNIWRVLGTISLLKVKHLSCRSTLASGQTHSLSLLK